MNAASELSLDVGKKPACEAVNVPRATFYRYLNRLGKPGTDDGLPTVPPLSLTEIEKQNIIDILHAERFQDKTPYEVFGTLLDEGQYHCSIRTMYRILKSEHGDVKERRKGHRRTHYKKPELLATAPNQVWSWDITKLKGPAKWTYFHLYVIMDIFSRYVVGWMVAHREQISLAKRLIEETYIKQNIGPDQLTIHADRGSSMKSKVIAQLMADLGITKTHSRPHVSNDNPYSESQFKTLKYCPAFPDRFGCIQDSRSFCRNFFAWYNKEHRHSGIGLMTPESIHYGLAERLNEKRSIVLRAAFQKNPQRFKGKIPQPPEIPTAVWINKPESENIRV
jgi:putative transposase